MLINCHTHTMRSHDSSADPFKICRSAVEAGLGGIVFTDHCDCEFHELCDFMFLMSSLHVKNNSRLEETLKKLFVSRPFLPCKAS